MLAAKVRHKDVVLILTKNRANLDVVDKVSVHLDVILTNLYN